MEKKLIEEIVNVVESYDPGSSEDIYRAYEFASKVHGNQKRKSGEPYIIHPLSVALILAYEFLDRDTICAGILHDVREDGIDITREQIEREFNPTVGMLVEGVTKMELELFPSKEAQNYANIRKQIMGIKIDLRIILMKLADSLHNQMTIKYLPRNKQIENSLMTLEIYAPLANRIGIHKWEKELCDLALRCLNDNLYQTILEQRQIVVDRDSKVLMEILNMVRDKLEGEGIDSQITARFKDVYPIYNKLFSHKISPSDIINLSKDDVPLNCIHGSYIHDMRAFKIIVSSENECYNSWNILGHEFEIVNGKMKNCINHPKTNGYQSLHATIHGIDGLPVQTRILTPDMDLIASLGLLTHWRKNRETAYDEAMRELNEFPFFSRLDELNHFFQNGGLENDRGFVDTVKKEVLSTMIFPVTKDGIVIELPQGATVADFAYRTYPLIGYTGCAAIVNGDFVPFDRMLNSNDIVSMVQIPGYEPVSHHARTVPARYEIKRREKQKSI